MGQLSFADVDPLADLTLRETTFVVVDLETTGGRASGDNHDAITEIGAVKVRGGEILGEFATLVDPGRSIPPQIVALTGITTAMVCDAPTIESVLPSFLEFSRGAVLVAHNAGFDIGFLRAAAERAHLPWPRPPVLCTVRLARRVLTRDEAPSVRLSALARLFSASTTPTHRALDDARATVDVLHGLIERVGNQGVHTYTELRSYLPDVTPAQRRNRHLAAPLPHRPGVYLFRGPASEVLYVGTAVDLRRRVGQYFNGADPRTRIKEMASLATAVDHVECAHDLEAGVRELRLLAAHAPPVQPALEVSAPVVVGGPDRRGVSAVLRRSGHRSTTARSARFDRGPTPRRRPRCWPGSPGCGHARHGWAGRRCTARDAPNAKSRHAPHRATSAPPTTPPPRSVPAT